jgi:hypothetical protein
MRFLILPIGMALLLAGCDAPADQSETASTNAESTGAQVGNFRAIAGEDIFSMIIPADATADQLALAARDQCGEREFCQVHGWLDEADAAKAMPMTDREVSTKTFHYAHNRATGFEQRMWDCERWQREDPNECISRD